MVEAGLNFVQTRLCCEFATLQHCPIAIARLLAILNFVSLQLVLLSVFYSIVSPTCSLQQCPCVSFAVFKLCLQLMSLKMSFVSPQTDQTNDEAPTNRTQVSE